MKLITKTLWYYLLISISLILIAGSFSFYFIKNELNDELTERMNLDKAYEIRNIKRSLNPEKVIFNTDGFIKVEKVKGNYIPDFYKDTTLFDKYEFEEVGCKLLISHIKKDKEVFRITIAKNTKITDELFQNLIFAFGAIVIFIAFGFFILNWLISKILWKPFFKTLNGLKNYDFDIHKKYFFEQTSISEFNQLNSTLNEMTERVYNSFTEQKEFTENASHEIQTPLAIIIANLSQLIQSPNLNQSDMIQIESIENNTRKLSLLNKSLLLLTKIENNQFPNLEFVSFYKLTDQLLTHFSALIESKKLNVEINRIEDFRLQMNPILAEILVSNLVSNAIRHNNDFGLINFFISKNSFTISNTGNPLIINENELFIRFKKNDSSLSSIGLGLSIVKSIINLYNLKINYTKKDNQHSFEISFNSKTD